MTRKELINHIRANVSEGNKSHAMRLYVENGHGKLKHEDFMELYNANQPETKQTAIQGL